MADISNKKLIKNTFEIVIMITLLAALLALAVISVANDMYAFVKPDASVTLNVDEPLDLSSMSKLLQSQGIIKNPTVFSLFVRSKGKADKLEAFSGEIVLRQDMSYREIMLALSQNKNIQ